MKDEDKYSQRFDSKYLENKVFNPDIGTETENLILESNRKVETCKEYEYLGTT